MQQISKYGITLTRLARGKIELVRRWRNHPSISQYMAFREHITPEMQEKWFQEICDSETCFYFIIEYGGKEIGLINIKDIDFERKTGEPGIFIWDADSQNTGIAFLAVFCLDDFCLDELGLKRVQCHILSSNKRAIRFNEYLGYTLEGSSGSLLTYSRALAKDSAMRARILRIYAPEWAGQ